jgi:5'-3' exonuclease
MARFAIVDLSNFFHRARHGTMGDADVKVGLSLHILFRSLRKIFRDLTLDHIVFAVDQGSWRQSIYPAYKSRRRLNQATATPHEQEENAMFFSALESLIVYLDTSTNCTVLRASNIEGDDFVARWIQTHPDDEHLIISGDSDFVQLLAPNVKIYDAINQRMVSIESVIDEQQGKTLAFTVSPKDGKIKIGQPDEAFKPEEEWWRKALFLKLVRGDTGDSVFSAFPGVRYEGKKHSIQSAWLDRTAKGFDWNNFMCQTWNKLVGMAPDGEKLTETVKVSDEFRINERVIDLTKQPTHIIQKMDEAIAHAISHEPVRSLGIQFLRFCKANDLPNLEKEADSHLEYLKIPYRKQQ